MTTKPKLDDELIQHAVDKAVRLACETLDDVFEGYDNKDHPGITSNFQGSLKRVVEKMLLGEAMDGRGTYLPKLVEDAE